MSEVKRGPGPKPAGWVPIRKRSAADQLMYYKQQAAITRAKAAQHIAQAMAEDIKTQRKLIDMEEAK